MPPSFWNSRRTASVSPLNVSTSPSRSTVSGPGASMVTPSRTISTRNAASKLRRPACAIVLPMRVRALAVISSCDRYVRTFSVALSFLRDGSSFEEVSTM